MRTRSSRARGLRSRGPCVCTPRTDSDYVSWHQDHLPSRLAAIDQVECPIHLGQWHPVADVRLQLAFQPPGNESFSRRHQRGWIICKVSAPINSRE
eukprot:scaffold27238_cov31-Tisochrysis_lutea.AAC.2